MKPDTGERELVFKLLQENSTLGQVAQYLKRKGLHYSAGSWDELFGKRVSRALEEKEKMGFSSVVSRPRILDQPSSPSLTDVRWEESLVAKVVEKRTYQRFVDQRVEGDFLVRRYRELTVRAVNLFKLHDDVT